MSTRTNIGINVLLLFFLSLGFPVRCFCEDLSLQKDRVLTEKEKKDARELISVIKARIEAAVNDSQIKRNKIPKNIPQNVVAHFKENPRVFLPSKEEVESQMKKQFEKVSLERLDVRAIAEKAIPQKFSAPVGVRIPECTGSRIRRDSFNKTGLKGDERKVLLADILYLKAEPDVGLSRKPFGKNTMVMTLHNESDPISILASLKGVPCVPFRERVFGTYTIKYEGRAALKNFDDAPIKGSFDDIVAKAYGISSKKEDSISLDELNENGQGG